MIEGSDFGGWLVADKRAPLSLNTNDVDRQTRNTSRVLVGPPSASGLHCGELRKTALPRTCSTEYGTFYLGRKQTEPGWEPLNFIRTWPIGYHLGPLEEF